MRKKIMKQVIFIVIIIFVIIIVVYCERFSTVKKAIHVLEAIRIMKNNEDYYIIKEDLNTGMSYYRNHKNGWEKMEYYGREPGMELSSVFTAANNRYLVKAKKTEEGGKTFLKIEEWNILFPIKRAYASEYENIRILYSNRKIDQFDVERGDYIKGLYTKEVVSVKDVEGKIKTEPNRYFVIVPKINEKVEWYFSSTRGIPAKEEDVVDKVEVEGATPEKYLSNLFLKEEKKERNGGIEFQRNIFIIKGHYNEKENRLYVEEWDFVDKIRRFYSEEEKHIHTEFYLDENDIKKGDYIPNGIE